MIAAACAPCMAGTLKVGVTALAGALGYSKVRDRKFKKTKKKGKKTKSKTKKGGGKRYTKKQKEQLKLTLKKIIEKNWRKNWKKLGIKKYGKPSIK